MADASFVFKISKEALRLIKEGSAVLSSGGVRLNTGELFELAKPSTVSNLISGLGSSGFAPVQLASSLGVNIQSAFIQKGVNAANLKLDQTLAQLGSLSSAMRGLQAVPALCWVNTAFSLANCGISIVGFKMTFDKLNAIRSEQRLMMETYQRDRASDLEKECFNYGMYLKGDLDFLTRLSREPDFDSASFHNREALIEEHLTKTCNHIRQAVNEAAREGELRNISVESLFMLAILYAQVLNEFSCEFYYANHMHPAVFEDWVCVFEWLKQDAFTAAVWKTLNKQPEYMLVSPVRMRQAQALLIEAVSEQADRLRVCYLAIETLDQKAYCRLDETINETIIQNLAKEKPNMDEQINAYILSGNYQDNGDDSILIPVF